MDKECHVDVIHKSPSIEERQEKATALLAVDGMGCPNCVNRVRNSLLLGYGVVLAFGADVVHVPLQGEAVCTVMRDHLDAYILAHARAEVLQGVSVAGVQEILDGVRVTTKDGRVFE